MHYVGFVFVDEPTVRAVADAMEPHKGDHWDWYRCGGRWDGYFGGEAEMKSRETHGGFNFDEKNNNPERNAKRVSELGEIKAPHFFVSGYDFVPRTYYNAYEKSPHHSGFGAILETPHFNDRWQKALADNREKWAVVVDAHN